MGMAMTTEHDPLTAALVQRAEKAEARAEHAEKLLKLAENHTEQAKVRITEI